MYFTWTRVPKQNQYVEIKQFSKSDIKQDTVTKSVFYLIPKHIFVYIYGGVERPNKKNISSFGRISKSFEQIKESFAQIKDSLKQIKDSFGRNSKSFEQIKESFEQINFERIFYLFERFTYSSERRNTIFILPLYAAVYINH